MNPNGGIPMLMLLGLNKLRLSKKVNHHIIWHKQTKLNRTKMDRTEPFSGLTFVKISVTPKQTWKNEMSTNHVYLYHQMF